MSSISKTSKVWSEFRENFCQHSGRVKLGCLQRLSSIEEVYCSVVSQSKILSLVFNTEEESFHFASISVYAKKFFLQRHNSENLCRVSFCNTVHDMIVFDKAFSGRYSKFVFLNSHDLISLSLVSSPCFFFIVQNAFEISSHEVLLPFLYSLVLYV